MKKIRWGIIGLGTIAHKFAQAVSAMDSVELEAVASRSISRAESFGKQFNIQSTKCYGSYEEIIMDDNLDAIYVALPNSLHKEISILCLKHGKAVLCEKPSTICEKEIMEVITVAENNKCFFMEAMKTRFLPIHQKIKEWIFEGKIGDVRLLQADYGYMAPYDPKNRLFYKDLGGGALLDLGIYCISYSTFIFGNYPNRIKSNLYIGSTGVDESVSINISYHAGKQAQLYSSINLETTREAKIIGTKGRILVPKFSNADVAHIYTDGKEEIVRMPFDINGFEYQIREVTQCINDGKLQSNIMSWDDSIESMRIIDLVRKNGDIMT